MEKKKSWFNGFIRNLMNLKIMCLCKKRTVFNTHVFQSTLLSLFVLLYTTVEISRDSSGNHFNVLKCCNFRYLCVCMRVCACECMRVCACECVCMCLRECEGMRFRVRENMCANVCVFMCVRVCVHVFTRV